ncbi:uncharacterized protein EV420DRAFT_1477357 [Desarmillaria tabescens]|uniref:Uncharacterized protein n=1 Tax=Armillaria tabescens TaxID=1929756 RepID=A0AA39NBQ0_ARMTA|nr:uncharacterized protein EV420DRAFT_1477357 [Desarmillaria tabescens]KAK0462666.1 hypothetical protein EV420DRAFT_1477357 [Desarmillaria tabescens]
MSDTPEDEQYDSAYLRRYFAQSSKIQQFFFIRNRLKDIRNAASTDESACCNSVMSALAWNPLVSPKLATELQWHIIRMVSSISSLKMMWLFTRDNLHNDSIELWRMRYGFSNTVGDSFNIGTAVLSELAIYQDNEIFMDPIGGQSLFQYAIFCMGGDIEGRLPLHIRTDESFYRGIDRRFVTRLRIHFGDATMADQQAWEQFGRHVTDLTVGASPYSSVQISLFGHVFMVDGIFFPYFERGSLTGGFGGDLHIAFVSKTVLVEPPLVEEQSLYGGTYRFAFIYELKRWYMPVIVIMTMYYYFQEVTYQILLSHLSYHRLVLKAEKHAEQELSI